MDQTLVTDIVRQAILLMMTLSAPVMMMGLLVGLIVALFQALTQIQEMTLAFVPKIMVILTMVYIFLPNMMLEMTRFMELISDQIIGGGR